MKWVLFLFVMLALAVVEGGSWYLSDDYYAGIDPNLKDDAMLKQLQDLINDHKSISYDEVWDAFLKIDTNFSTCTSAQPVKGPYSKYCWDKDEQCGSYHKEGDCYNREHSWPKSWWGGFSNGKGAQTDLFHLYPTDGYVNGRRSSYPLGIVSNPTYVSSNGGKIGDCVSEDYTDTCFEVADEYKGDLARSYFYISTCYRGIFDCCDEAGVDGSSIKPWMEDILREWHHSDPVSEKEVERNNNIFEMFQHNRNPYIDHPEWVDQISDF